MYYKMINDRMVFSDCRTIQTNEGVWISNPSQEQIADAGWQVYTPPIVPPQPQTEPDMEQMIEAVKKMLASSTEELSDEDALDVAALFPTWLSKVEEAEASGKGVEAGERLWYDGKLYKVVQAHVPQRTWTPDHTPALFTEISIEEWPEWVQPTGAHDAYNRGDKVTFEGAHYVSLIDGNVYSPAVYPAGWELQP